MDYTACYILIILVYSTNMGQPMRYRYCSQGCCPQEFCAFHTICYPKVHCRHGCPDGTCQENICMPTQPCKRNSECSFAHVCTRNYNLGYDTCQYNLDIGKTVCVDREGNPLLTRYP